MNEIEKSVVVVLCWAFLAKLTDESVDQELAYNTSRSDAENLLTAAMMKRKEMMKKLRDQNRISAAEQKNFKKFSEVSGSYIDTVIDTFNKLEDVWQTMAPDGQEGRLEG